ncbi:AAA family ATPase [Tengunoibacter tsumagoiensis]|uniref:AAA+ ATPase domain-containing protein n=1 Tax=Tengunoibacter tsumagoiensis TaxID=2014871 RepID=A0A402A5T3_9CHLR|nr:ATP-binding protein [Tengunoibacter tsumagoiensis]GCE14504.1 hypothetical protein KTT_43630 [Tengunoibacter tsumagoiensis]
MQLEQLTIAHYKNLHNFTIDFRQKSQTMVLIGQNGAGKSTLLEALIFIFRNLDLGEQPPFKYSLAYYCQGSYIQIVADPNEARLYRIHITVDGQPITYKRFYLASEPRYLPRYVFGYYSGLNDHMLNLFDKHHERFYGEIVRGLEHPSHPLIYAQAAYRQFSLLSFFIEQDQQCIDFLERHLGILELESVSFLIAEPSWKSQEGDRRFWNARGAVQKALSYLYDAAEEPVQKKVKIRLDHRTVIRRDCLSLELQNQQRLQRFYSFYQSPQAFFHALTCIEMSGMLVEVSVHVRVRNADGSVASRSLSEGEQQLLMVLGLLRFTRDEETLFLLDEPDTHLNPVWSIQYLDLIEQMVGPHHSSQLLMSTHNPLFISSLDRSQVRIMSRNPTTQRIEASEPMENPRGMGVASILTSDLFGLRSTLDPPTQQLVDQRRELALKAALTGEKLSQEERQQLTALNQQLQDLDFSITTYDPLYQHYVREMTRREEPPIRQSIQLTDEQRQRQKDLTRQVLRELREKKEPRA